MDNHKTCCQSAYTNYILRFALGGMLIFMAIGKLMMGVSTFVQNTSPLFEKSVIPTGLVTEFLFIVPWLELILGTLILLGLFTRFASILSGFLFALFAIGLVATGNTEMTGAIGDNFIYIFAALWLKKTPIGKISLDHRSKKKGSM